LSILVVYDFFMKGLRDALDQSAVNLAFDQQRIDYVSAIIDGDLLRQSGFACLFVQFDDTDMRTERESEI